MNDTPQQRDLLAEWLELGREVLRRYWPEAKYGLLLVHLGPDLPDATFPVIPQAHSGLDGLLLAPSSSQ